MFDTFYEMFHSGHLKLTECIVAAQELLSLTSQFCHLYIYSLGSSLTFISS